MFAPCIMCVQYRGGCSVPWGDIMSTVVGYLEYRGGYHDKCGGYLEDRGGCSVPWGDIMSTVGVILSTVGGYHDACGGISWVPWGCSVPWGDTILWNLSTVGDIMMHVEDIMSTVGYSNNKRLFPHSTEHPPRYSWYPPTCIMISPHGTEHPPRYSR